MKNDIDSLLDSMFRGGRLQFRSSQQGEKKGASQGEASPLEKAASRGESAQQALQAVEQAGDNLSASLQESIERLTQEARADMADLERHLRQDGVDPERVARNTGAPVDRDLAFQVARQEAGALVLGQDAFLDNLLIAFKRPFVAGSEEKNPLCRVAVLGPHGTAASYTHLDVYKRQLLDGYHSDMTRTVALGKVSEEQKAVYETVLKAHLAVIDYVKPGVICSDVDKVARDIIEKDYPGTFVHGLEMCIRDSHRTVLRQEGHLSPNWYHQ